MLRKIPYLLLFLCITSCIVKKKTTYGKERKVRVAASEEKSKDIPSTVTESTPLSRADDIINTALTFSGVRYKYGGSSKKGMDCSGLLYVSFQKHEVPLPRVSYDMAKQGKNIKVKQVTKGDLLFFKTEKTAKRINHVGLVVAVDGDDIKFIHATSSRGVIVSSLKEGYWNYAFVKATRIL